MTRTDDELLALAAKAGGIDTSKVWNALTNSGDALELAVKLDLCITQWRSSEQYPPHVMVGYRAGPKFGSNWIEEHGADDLAATRRAIVCAAADIGARS